MLLLQCLCITVQGQNLLIEAGAGIAGNTGIKNRDIRSRGKGFAAPGVHMALMADMKRWQVGVIGDVYSIRHSTSFVYEQYLTPDGAYATQYTNTGVPALTISALGNYKLPVAKSGSYVFAGPRAGVILFPGKNVALYEWTMSSTPEFIYGLQAGFCTHSNARFSTGFMLSWQQYQSSKQLSYVSVYMYEDVNKMKHYIHTPISKFLPYTVNTYNVQVFLRYNLHLEKKVKKAEQQED